MAFLRFVFDIELKDNWELKRISLTGSPRQTYIALGVIAEGKLHYLEHLSIDSISRGLTEQKQCGRSEMGRSKPGCTNEEMRDLVYHAMANGELLVIDMRTFIVVTGVDANGQPVYGMVDALVDAKGNPIETGDAGRDEPL